jgi:Cu-Zn family superoxide dismutase
MHRFPYFITVALGLVISGCKHAPEAEGVSPAVGETTVETEVVPPEVPLSARATIEARSGSSLAGEVTFTESEQGTRIVLKVRSTSPGRHAVHVHEIGDCSSPDGKSAGPHFNPDDHPHAGPADERHHAGDLGNMEVAEDGTGTLELVSQHLTVADGPKSVVGRSIIVHAKADDFVTQPTGAAGARIGCGVIAR